MIDNLIQSFKQFAPDFLSSYCIINGSILELDEVEKMGYYEFSNQSRLSVPLKLYKYFPNKVTEENGKLVNYSIQALKNNTVYLQSPTQFEMQECEIKCENCPTYVQNLHSDIQNMIGEI